MRALKRPDGELHEEYTVTGVHFFEDGELAGHDHDSGQGLYTGRFKFIYPGPGGKQTRWYTKRTAPNWLLAYFEESTTGEIAQ